jgi:hypothetical protein
MLADLPFGGMVGFTPQYITVPAEGGFLLLFGFQVGDGFADTAAQGIVAVESSKAVFLNHSELIPAVILVTGAELLALYGTGI